MAGALMKKTHCLVSLLLLGTLLLEGDLVFASEEPDCQNPLTTIEINRCTSLELEAAEMVMETYLAKSKERYARDLTIVRSIDEAQAAWLIYRQTHCGSVFNVWRQGTIRTVMSISCSIELTQQRTVEIWNSFLTYPDSTPPLLPAP